MKLCAHKPLLLVLARSHAEHLRHGLALARATFGDLHPRVAQLRAELEYAEDCEHEVELLPASTQRAPMGRLAL